MSSRLRLAAALALAAALPACIRIAADPVVREPPAALERHVLCPSVARRGDWAEAGPALSAFVRGPEARVVSFLAFRSVLGLHSLAWKWYGPDGAAYRQAEPVSIGAEGRLFTRYVAWDQIFASEDKTPGRWTVAVFLDGKLLATKTFEMK